MLNELDSGLLGSVGGPWGPCVDVSHDEEEGSLWDGSEVFDGHEDRGPVSVVGGGESAVHLHPSDPEACAYHVEEAFFEVGGPREVGDCVQWMWFEDYL